MSRQSINFWVLFTISIILSAIVISVFVKALKVILMVILILALAPIIYLVLRLIIPGQKTIDENDKLKKRH
ncbi:hypothetical protein JAO76_17205 [Pontibacter sp. BT310]|jgi:hypothetical protein|uniref:Uncharacterized protein n=1 Tax=Pontibacter populi TaxID=890055 RepID=A0ABS6XI15_9BACT|nr:MULTISPECIES: hypothetical protein [Pontibacter]MBJ6119948.1 hypothetical protein [Pontibacter sp. BT310]MBR0572377.1 hypothetical protein [Microvirga sp. STS03]MBW3366801.1 hypothetical protein [Pontibacter populi]